MKEIQWRRLNFSNFFRSNCAHRYYLRYPTIIMPMQKRMFLAVLFVMAAFIVFSCSSSRHSKVKRLPGTWPAQPVTIDGYDNDWPSPYPEYDDKAMLGYAVSNDKENLYITVQTGDLATQLKILHEGLTVWIDRKGEKGEETAINYPIPMPAQNDARDHRQKQPQSGQQGLGDDRMEKRRMDLEDKVRAALGEAKEYSLQGFKACNLQFPILETDSCGIVVRIGIDSTNEMIWEAKIPFKAFYFKPQLTRADRGKPISVCFETTAMKRPTGQSPAGGGHGGGGFRPSVGIGGFGGMGMGMSMGGGGMHRGGSRNNNTNTPDIMEPAYKSTKTYKKFGLAYKD